MVDPRLMIGRVSAGGTPTVYPGEWGWYFAVVESCPIYGAAGKMGKGKVEWWELCLWNPYLETDGLKKSTDTRKYRAAAFRGKGT